MTKNGKQESLRYRQEDESSDMGSRGKPTTLQYSSSPVDEVSGRTIAAFGERLGEDISPSAGEIVKICKACTSSNPNSAEFCIKCGEKLLTIRPPEQEYLGELIAGKFKIVEFIDRGGMGEVYLGIQEALEHRVAVKFLNRKFSSDPRIVRRFLNEARSYCRITHPNAVKLLEYGQHEDGAIYIITEFVEGRNLTETMREYGLLSIDQAVSLAMQVAEVISVAHHENIIHRDLKPDNLMLIPGKRGRFSVKVLDFGIAKYDDSDKEEQSYHTETGAVFGTPEFMSPEQACGDGAEYASDIYALGIIVFYMLTGKLPFTGKSKFTVLTRQINHAPPRPSELAPHRQIPPELEQIVLRCMEKDPADRYESADDLLDALEMFRSSNPTPTWEGPLIFPTEDSEVEWEEESDGAVQARSDAVERD